MVWTAAWIHAALGLILMEMACISMCNQVDFHGLGYLQGSCLGK